MPRITKLYVNGLDLTDLLRQGSVSGRPVVTLVVSDDDSERCLSFSEDVEIVESDSDLQTIIRYEDLIDAVLDQGDEGFF